jgi:hypothetical protein
MLVIKERILLLCILMGSAGATLRLYKQVHHPKITLLPKHKIARICFGYCPYLNTHTSLHIAFSADGYKLIVETCRSSYVLKISAI